MARDEVPCRRTNAEILAGKNMYDFLVELNDSMGENGAPACIISFMASMTEDEEEEWCEHMNGCAECLQEFLHNKNAPRLRF